MKAEDVRAKTVDPLDQHWLFFQERACPPDQSSVAGAEDHLAIAGQIHDQFGVQRLDEFIAEPVDAVQPQYGY